jgi:Tol biopolymer transport system component/CubicO group peptidase (beta-lactamase class C family)
MIFRLSRSSRMLRWPRFLVSLSVLSAFIVASCTTIPVSTPPARADWPTQDWQTASPGEQGLDANKLAALRAKIERDLPFLHSLLIIKNGRLVYEQYFAGYDQARLNELESVTKSFTSALVGIAQASGKLRSPDVTIGSAAPQYFTDGRHADKKNITLRNLLMMRSGIQFDNTTLPTQTQQGRQAFLQQDTVEYALSQPVAFTPGRAWNYSSADTQLAAAILEGVTGVPLQQYAAEKLFAPLGITRFEWSSDAAGHTIAGGLLRLTTRDMAKLGYLYLNHGAWDGKQIVPAAWVQLTTSPQGSAYLPWKEQATPITWYGYGWWTWQPGYFSGHRAFSADGSGGQLVVLIPDLDMIVVTTADSFVAGDVSENQASDTYDLIRSDIVPAAAAPGTADSFWTVKDAKDNLPREALYVVGADGKGQKRLLEDPNFGFWGPAWSPDNRQIVYTRLTPHVIAPGSVPGELYVANADGSSPRQLTNNGRSNYFAAWSLDGRRIAYLSQRGDNTDSAEIYTIRSDGSGEARLTNNKAQEYGLSWSPDGKQIVFGRQQAGDWQIYTMNADGSNQSPLPTAAMGNAPSWSPDGRQIAFTSERSGNSEVYVMERDGSNQRNMTNNQAFDMLPQWSPDGKRIAFISNRDGRLALLLMAADGSNLVTVSGKGLNVGLASWSADGTQLVFHATAGGN